MKTIEYIIKALDNLSGEAPLSDIYCEYKKLCKKDGKKLPESWKASVRGRIETHSSDTDSYINTYPDFFTAKHGLGKGYWALRKYPEKSRNINYWWVNQNQTHKKEI